MIFSKKIFTLPTIPGENTYSYPYLFDLCVHVKHVCVDVHVHVGACVHIYAHTCLSQMTTSDIAPQVLST